MKALIKKECGIFSFIRYYLDGLSNVSSYQEDICKTLLKNKNVREDTENLFVLYVKLAILLLKDDNFSKEIEMLKLALGIKQNDLVANYRLAISYERNNSVDDAITHYKRALNDPMINSKILEQFILKQIERVETTGPLKKPPTLGLKYTSW